MTYLSYLLPTTAEQEQITELLGASGAWDDYVAAGVASAKQNARYLNLGHNTVGQGSDEPGGWLAVSKRLRGLTTEPVRPITTRTWLPPGEDWRAFDWHAAKHGRWHGYRTWRWSGPNPRPRLLLPYSCGGHASVAVTVLGFVDGVDESLRLLVDGQPVVHSTSTAGEVTTLAFETTLRADRPTVLEFRMTRTGGAPSPTGRLNAWSRLIAPTWRRRLEHGALNASPGMRRLIRRVYRRTPLTMVSRPRKVGLALAGISITPR